MKLTVIGGTRSELIKLAPAVRAFRQRGLATDLILTGQHRDLVAGIPELFDLPEPRFLDFHPTAPGLNALASSLIERIDQAVLQTDEPSAVVVQGDTLTAYAAALAAFYRRMPVAHIEAGLRTFDPTQPFPEEMHRTQIARLATWHFCPTVRAKANLLREGVSPQHATVTGNTAIDAIRFVLTEKMPADYGTKGLFEEAPELARRLESIKGQSGATLSVFTVHRRENQQTGLIQLLSDLKAWMVAHPRHHVIIPYHLNPWIKETLFQQMAGPANVHLIPPLGYRPMLHLLSQCHFVVSDSGGLQEETPSFKKPLLILRQVTERPEVLEKGLARAIGLDRERFLTEFSGLVAAAEAGSTPRWFRRELENPFGDGLAAGRIADRLLLDLGRPTRLTA